MASRGSLWSTQCQERCSRDLLTSLTSFKESLFPVLQAFPINLGSTPTEPRSPWNLEAQQLTYQSFCTVDTQRKGIMVTVNSHFTYPPPPPKSLNIPQTRKPRQTTTDVNLTNLAPSTASLYLCKSACYYEKARRRVSDTAWMPPETC